MSFHVHHVKVLSHSYDKNILSLISFSIFPSKCPTKRGEIHGPFYLTYSINSFQLLELPCRHRDLRMLRKNDIEFNERTARYLQIRRCSSCRLRRCFEVGMKEERVRTEAENERHKELVEINRVRREGLKQQLSEIHQLSIPQVGHFLAQVSVLMLSQSIVCMRKLLFDMQL